LDFDENDFLLTNFRRSMQICNAKDNNQTSSFTNSKLTMTQIPWRILVCEIQIYNSYLSPGFELSTFSNHCKNTKRVAGRSPTKYGVLVGILFVVTWIPVIYVNLSNF